MRRLPIKPYWDLLAAHLRPQWRQVALLVLLVVVSIALQLANPQIVAFFIDTAENNPSSPGTSAFAAGLNRLLGAAALFMAIAIVRQAIAIAAAYVGENVAWTATNALRADLALHCLRLDMAFHKQHKPGELIERVDGDVNKLANFFSQLFIQLTSNLLLLAGVIVLLWLMDWRIGLSITAVAGLGVLVLNALNKRTVPRWQALRQAEANLFGYLEEWLTGTEVIRTCAAEPYVMGKLYRLMRTRWLRMRSAMRMNVLVMSLPVGVFTLAYIAAHVFGATLFRNSALTIGGVYLIFYYIDLIKDPLWRVIREIEELQRATASINRIIELTQEQSTLADGPGQQWSDGPLAVQFDHVSFFYADDPETVILDDVHFQLAPGTVLGLLGRTGSGKSTLTKLLFRFYDPTSGAIRLGRNGRLTDIRQATQADIRRQVGMVTQEVQLFHASVRDNLTMFDDSIDDGRILTVLEELGLSTWLASLPAGLDTELEGDSGLSAGEAQLLAFVRVFLADPGVVILDEASSRLDPVTEQLIEHAIDRLLADRTGIIVAHRLGTVQRADEIMILADGRIQEHGPREDLTVNPDSRFAALLQTGLEEAFA